MMNLGGPIGLSISTVVVLSNGSGAFLLYDGGKLVFLRLREMGNGWVVVHDGKSFKFDDIVEYRGKLYGANRRGRAYRIDCDTLEMELIAASVQGGPGRRKRLVQAHEQLFLVMTCPLSGDMCKTKLKVYQLKDQNRSRKKEAKELSGLCPGNCILFTANSFQNYNGPDDLCLFSVSSSMNLHIGVFNLETDRSIGPMDSHSCYSDLLWPPPAWLGPMKMSELIEALRAAIEGFCSRSKAAKDKVHELPLQPFIGPSAASIHGVYNSSATAIFGF